MSEYDWLLFLHLLAAFAVVAGVVVLSAFAFGWTRDGRILGVASAVWGIGAAGTLVFGVWLALYVGGYHIYDGWIIAALVLWAIAGGLGEQARVGYAAMASDSDGNEGARSPSTSRAALFHWARSLAVLALLVVMIYKPGA